AVNIEHIRQAPTHPRGRDGLDRFIIIVGLNDAWGEHYQQFGSLLRFGVEAKGGTDPWNATQHGDLRTRARATFANQPRKHDRLSRISANRGQCFDRVDDRRSNHFAPWSEANWDTQVGTVQAR